MLNLLIGPVSDLLNTVLKRILPAEKMSELDRAKLQAELNSALLQFDWNSVEKEYEDRVSARKLAEADVARGNWFTNILAATVRPVFGYVVMTAFFLSWATAFFPTYVQPVEITPIQKEIMLSVIYFYFGGRVVEKGLKIWTGEPK